MPTTDVLEREILSRTPEQIVPLLYEHLLTNLHDATHCIENGDLHGRSRHIDRSLAILFELMGSLDLDRGGELADRLGALYSYFATEIIGIGRSGDTELLRRIMDMIRTLHHSWEHAAAATAGRPAAPDPLR
jgi:flagellar secretion chaperone FliS